MTNKNDGVSWDLSSFFPEFNGPDMTAFKDKLRADIKDLQVRAEKLEPLSKATMDEWESVLLDAEDFDARLGHLFSYVGCLESAHAENEDYAKERASLAGLAAEYSKFDVDILRAFKEVPDGDFDAFIGREKLKTAAHSFRRCRERAKKTMSPAEEKLSADLGVDGIHAWGRLYDKLSSRLEFEMRWPDGRKERKPISQWRSLMSDADRKVGRAAFEGGNRAWVTIEDGCASALNAIAGTRLTLYRHRGVEHFLDKALFSASIERRTLDAMYEAIHRNLDTARDIFRSKAKSLGRQGVAFFEREAPLPLKDSKLFTWAEGSEMVGKAFENVYPKLGEYYRTFLKNRWMESESRGGKRPGAFCTGSPFINEERVFMTFNGALGDVTTVAHEVGHAFHGFLMRDMRPMAREYPMTLAETASIFGEHILAEGIYESGRISDSQKLLMLDADLCGAAVLLLDITVRFEFEKAFYTERGKGELSVSRFKELMVDAQKRVFGDALEPGGEDPMFWASKLHFYISELSFYNFPYTFGFLLAKALFNRMKEEGPSFLPRYEEFLRLTGSDTVEGVAKRTLNVDVGDPAFWESSIKSIEEPLKRYKGLLETQSLTPA